MVEMKSPASSDLSSCDEADEGSEYKDESPDEIQDTRPRRSPKDVQRQKTAAEMFDPVPANRKCYRCWKTGVDCLLPFESDQIDAKCNRCQAEKKPYCNVNDRREFICIIAA